jgi:hypothetical protein
MDSAVYTCMLISYRRLSPQFQFSLSAVTLVYVYLSQWSPLPPPQSGHKTIFSAVAYSAKIFFF